MFRRVLKEGSLLFECSGGIVIYSRWKDGIGGMLGEVMGGVEKRKREVI